MRTRTPFCMLSVRTPTSDSRAARVAGAICCTSSSVSGSAAWINTSPGLSSGVKGEQWRLRAEALSDVIIAQGTRPRAVRTTGPHTPLRHTSETI